MLLMSPVFITPEGVQLSHVKTPTAPSPEVEIDPMERLRMEAEKAAAQASSPKCHLKGK